MSANAINRDAATMRRSVPAASGIEAFASGYNLLELLSDALRSFALLRLCETSRNRISHKDTKGRKTRRSEISPLEAKDQEVQGIVSEHLCDLRASLRSLREGSDLALSQRREDAKERKQGDCSTIS